MFTYIFTLWSACFRFHLKIILSLGHEYGWYFLHKCFIVWCLTSRFHPTWKCLLHVVWGNFFGGGIFLWLVCCSSTVYWKDFPFPTALKCLLCYILSVDMCRHLFLDYLVLLVFPYANIHSLHYSILKKVLIYSTASLFTLLFFKSFRFSWFFALSYPF